MVTSFRVYSVQYPPLTARDDNPDKVHEEIIAPEIVCFWPAVCKTLVIVIKHTSCVVEDVAVDLAHRYYGL